MAELSYTLTAPELSIQAGSISNSPDGTISAATLQINPGNVTYEFTERPEHDLVVSVVPVVWVERAKIKAVGGYGESRWGDMIAHARLYPQSDFYVLARIVKSDGTILTMTDGDTPFVTVSAWIINYPVRTGRDNNTGPYIFRGVTLTNEAAASTDETKSIWFPSLQTDSKWQEDDRGYNFAHYVDVDALKQTITATTSNIYGEVADAPLIEEWSTDNSKVLLEYDISDTTFGAVKLRATIDMLPSDTHGQTTL